jgi:ABC-type transport system involved in multi-copper enzyme maturation permease subunit
VSSATSLRDALLVARFQLARAVRTRSALALCTLYLLGSTGVTYVFTRILLEIENETARLLKVPVVTRPGAMLDTLRERGDLENILGALVGSPDLLDWALQQPILSIIHFWFALGVLPFLAVAVGAESVAPDARNRSLRFELVRTGRLELITGRFIGQAVLLFVATCIAPIGTWLVAMLGMVNQPPLEQASTLLVASPRLWLWSLPFLGLGVACSQLTSTVNFARSIALGATVGTWLLFATTKSEWAEARPYYGALIEPIVPQSYLMDLWGPGTAWMASGAVLGLLGFVAALSTLPIFARRNL